MRYELDLSGMKQSSFPDEMLDFKFPCETGSHQLKFDFIEREIPKHIYEKMLSIRMPGNGEKYPIGFDNIPVGATLKRIS